MVWRALLLIVSAVMVVYSAQGWKDNFKPPASTAETAFFALSIVLMVWAAVMTLLRPFRCIHWFFLVIPVLNAARKWVSAEGNGSCVPSSVLLWCLAVLFLLRTRPEGAGARLPGLRRYLLLYVALGFVSVFAASLIHVPESRAMLSTVTGILEPAVLLYLTYLCCWWGGETLRTVRGLVLGGAGCVVLWVLLYRLGAGATDYALGADDAGMVRSVLGSMTFGNLTHFALAALVAFPLAFLKEVHRGRLAGIRRYGILGLLACGVFLGSSRAGLLALALEVLLLIRLRLVPRKMLMFLLVLMAASVVVFRETLLLRWEDVAEGYSGRLTPGDLSRVEGWKVALQSIAVYPLGIGGGNFDFAWQRWSTYIDMFGGLFPYIGGPHNIWLSVASEYGVPFLLALVGLLALFTRAAWRVARRARHPFERRLARVLLVAVVGFFAMGTVGDAELSHLTARVKPMNAHTLFLFGALGVIAAGRRSLSAGETLLRSPRARRARPLRAEA
jgi:O-antigen ligase